MTETSRYFVVCRRPYTTEVWVANRPEAIPGHAAGTINWREVTGEEANRVMAETGLRVVHIPAEENP
jgi:hypothetical protein